LNLFIVFGADFFQLTDPAGSRARGDCDEHFALVLGSVDSVDTE
jgi:hypothetical protein